MANRLLGFFANLPIGIPISISFRKWHLEHHRVGFQLSHCDFTSKGFSVKCLLFVASICLQYQGDEVLDTDIPTYLEAKLFCTTVGKFCWVLLQPFFYAFRPMIVYPKTPEPLEVINLAIQLVFDALVYYFFGKCKKMSWHEWLLKINLRTDLNILFLSRWEGPGLPYRWIPHGNGLASCGRPFYFRALYV